MKVTWFVWRIFLLSSFVGVSAAESIPKPESDQEKPLDTTGNYRFNDVDIFGDAAIGSMYILWDNIDLTIELKKSIQEKSFATDEFYMQNIDREQFEQERILKLFDDQKQEFFRLFPAMQEDEDEDDDLP